MERYSPGGALRGIEGFEWDPGNAHKNWRRHRVTQSECEQVLLGHPLVVGPDTRHSTVETRQIALGQTATGRLLMVAFTVRGQRLRVISARPMSRRERGIYAKAKADDKST
jgi:uncharacterized protein